MTARPDRAAAPLVERDGQLRLLRARLGDALAGSGATVCVEGPAGRGKSALLRALRGEVGTDARLLAAVGGELEREFTFGVVRQLLEPVVHGASDERRRQLLSGAAELAGPLLGVGPLAHEPGEDATFAVLHGLYWFVAALSEERPLVLVVDDLHWSDAASLRFLTFLARRAGDLPILLLLGTRPEEPGTETDLLEALADTPEVETVRPGPLSPAGTAAVVARHGISADDDALRAAHEATGGNPLLLRELARELARTAEPAATGDGPPGGPGAPADAPEPIVPVAADDVRRAVPPSVVRAVQRRVGRLEAPDRAVARALAVLGDRRPAEALATVVGWAPERVVAALGTLERLELVEGPPARFAHPLVRSAVLRGLTAGELADLHRRAATALHERGAEHEEAVAVHLLGCPAVGEPWAVEALRRSAARAAADGDPDAAIRRLERAAEEPTDDEGRGALLLELGVAQLRSHDPGAAGTLSRAVSAGDDRLAAAALEARSSVGVRLDADEIDAAARDLEAALQRLGPDGDPVVVGRLRGRLLGAMNLTGRLRDRRSVLLETWMALPDPGRPVRQVHAFERACRGAPASEVRGLLAGLGDGAVPLGTIEDQLLWGIYAAVVCDLVDLAADRLAAARATARRAGSPYAMSLLAHMEIPLLLRSGSVAAAEALARETLETAVRAGFAQPTAQMTAEVAEVLVLQGRLDEADTALSALPDDAWEGGTNVAWLRGTRGRLRLAQRRPEDAVDDLSAVDEQRRDSGWELWPRLHDGPSLALALARAGRTSDAAERATSEVELGRRREVPAHEAEALLARAATEDGARRTATVEEAVAAARRSPSGVVLAGALIEHGRELRLARAPSRAREPLREALEIAGRCGATALVARADDELLAAGARPRRAALSGLASLTPAERRTAELAAQGLSNREVAETLFVTRKTVEVHLGRAYAKLGITSRAQLAAVLGAR